MSKTIEKPIYTPDIKGGDVFVLTQVKEPVFTQCGGPNTPIVETVHSSLWQYDEKLSKAARTEYNRNVQDWLGNV